MAKTATAGTTLNSMRMLLLPALLLLLAACSGGEVIKPCPDPDPDPTGICASSHGHTYGGS